MKVVIRAWFMAARSTMMLGTRAVRSATGSARSTGTGTTVFGCAPLPFKFLNFCEGRKSNPLPNMVLKLSVFPFYKRNQRLGSSDEVDSGLDFENKNFLWCEGNLTGLQDL